MPHNRILLNTLLCTILLLALKANPLWAADTEATNYCNNKASWTEWEALLADKPGDKDIRILYALRIGLCTMVDRGELTLQESTTIFENQRNALIQHKNQPDSETKLAI